MFDFSPIKILLVVVVTAILLGPDKLPHVAKSLGNAWRSLKKVQSRVEGEVREAMPDLPGNADLARFARSPIHLLNELAQRVATSVEDGGEPSTAEESETPVTPEPPLGLTLRKPLVNPVTNWQPPTGPFDPSLN